MSNKGGSSSGNAWSNNMKAVGIGALIGIGISYAIDKIVASANSEERYQYQGRRDEEEHVKRKKESRKEQPANFVPKEELACIVCYGNERDFVLLPCRHMCVCVECSEKVKACPYCNSLIEDKKVVYLP